MNRILNTLTFATACFALLSGCSTDPTMDDNSGGNGNHTVPVSFAAELPTSRATIDVGSDRFNGAWEADIDKLGIHATLSGASQINKPFTYSSDGVFKGELTPGTGAWTYLAYYPHGEQALSGTSATVPFGNTRTQKDGIYNSLFDVLVAPAQTTTNSAEGVDDNGEQIRFNMKRLTSILDFDLTNSTTDPIRCVLLTAVGDNFLSAKTLNFDIAQGETATPALGTEEQSKSILLNFEGGSASAAAKLDAIFNVLPGNYKLNLDVITTTKQMASVEIDRTNTGKPFEAGVLYKKEVGTLTPAAIPAPALNWPNQDINATHEITVTGSIPFDDLSLTYPAAIDITAAGGIADLKVEIVSAALNSMNITNLDLVNETSIGGAIEYNSLGLKCGTEIQYAKSTVFDITKLVPMISILPGGIGTHVFKVSVTDLAGQTTTQDLTFHYGQVTVNSTDLWQNTAALTIKPTTPASTIELEYKRSTETDWQQATVTPNGDDTYAATIAPSWIDTTNEDGVATKILNNKTGIFASATYDYRLMADGAEVETAQFTTATGNAIPDGSFENTWKNGNQFLNSGGSPTNYNFWGSGYNSFAANLCTRDETMVGRDGNYCAKLQASYNGTAKIPAPGNLFTANFKISIIPMGGYVSFGKKYEYNARPSAVKVKVHAKIGIVDYNLYGGPIEVGQPDKGRVMVCIVDWTKQHEVFAGKANPKNTWDPNKVTTVDEGPIIGYASKFITSTVGDAMEEITIPICYNDDTAAAPAGAFNIVVNCSTSAYGDYMDACTTNTMYLDDFQWVY